MQGPFVVGYNGNRRYPAGNTFPIVVVHNFKQLKTELCDIFEIFKIRFSSAGCRHSHLPIFFIGQLAVSAASLSDSDKRKSEYMEDLMQKSKYLKDKCHTDEVLNGRAGYLFSLLYVQVVAKLPVDIGLIKAVSSYKCIYPYVLAYCRRVESQTF